MNGAQMPSDSHWADSINAGLQEKTHLRAAGQFEASTRSMAKHLGVQPDAQLTSLN